MWRFIFFFSLMMTVAGAREGFRDLEMEVHSQGAVISGPLREAGAGTLIWEPDRNGFSARLHFVGEGDSRAAWLEYDGPAPDPVAGVRVHMKLPEFGRGLSIGRFKLHWTAPVFTSDYRTLSPRTLLLLWQEAGTPEDFQVLLPLSGEQTVGEMGGRDFKFGVHLSTHCEGTNPRYMPLFAWARGEDPYALPERALKLAQTLPRPPRGRLRTEKPYPEPFRYLGWCSWNTYYHSVSAEKVLTSVRSLQEKGVPIRWVLVDDGWLTLKKRTVAGFDAVEDKFPGGLAALVSALKDEHEITWVGVWHTLQGYWDGVDPGLSPHLLAGRDGLYLPHPERAGEFFSSWYRVLAEAGIDFVKVDNQARNARFAAGVMPLFEVSRGLHAGLEEAAERYLPGGLLNCMDMAPETAFNWGTSNLARNSEDYIPEEPWNPCDHVFQNAYSALWTSNFAYPDYDMFETHHAAADMHAIARAISGGPIYTTDTPGKENAEILRALCLADGKLLRVDQPGQVTKDCLLVDTSLQPVPLKVFGRVGDTGMVAAFNVNKTAQRVEGTVRAKDVEGLEPGAYAFYQRSNGLCGRLDEPLAFALGSREGELFTVAPIVNGAAVFGLLDKLIGPAAVGEVTRNGDRLSVEVLNGGTLGVYLQKAPAGVEGATSWSYDDGLLKVEMRDSGRVVVRR